MKKTISVIAMLLIFCCALSACKEAESLTGTWTCTEEGVSISMIFNADGTGKIETLGGLMSVDYAYQLKGDTIIFHELNQEVLGTTPYTYSINGDKLSLTADGNTMVLTKDK